ncbi:MAG: hypothetical protein AAFQ82_27250, partial [Myxococcota bacterium]
VELDQPGWTQGTQVLSLRYDDQLPPGSETALTFEAVWDVDGSLRGTSDALVVESGVVLDRFEFAVPTHAEPGVPFTVTVTALGSNGEPFADFTGAVRLSAAIPNAPLTPTTTPQFVAGVAQFDVTYGALDDGLVLTATDGVTTGSSSPVVVGLQNGLPGLTLTAVPLRDDGIRIDWSRVDGATSVRLFAAQGGGDEALIATLVAGTFSFFHSGLVSGESYRYRLEVTGDDGVLGTATAEARPANCTVAAAVTEPTVWTMTQSPYCIPSGQPDGNFFPVQSSLVIEAGVVVLIAPNTGIRFDVVGSSLFIDGARDAPVIITSEQEEPEPWGLIDLQNALDSAFDETLTNIRYVGGSRIRNAIFSYGTRLDVRISLDIES